MKNLIALIGTEAFGGNRPRVIGTGGFARMFEAEGIFDEIVPELVLYGLRYAEQLNRDADSKHP